MADNISEQEMIQIANNFLLASPPGEFMEVVTDVRGLLPDDSLINDTAPQTFREYNTDQMLQVQVGDRQVLITKYGEVSANEYLDPKGGQVISFDHIRQEVQGSRAISGELPRDVEPYRSAIDNAAINYVNEHYMNGACAVYGSKESDNAHNVTICISSSKFNPNNFYNGRWRSVWSCLFHPNGQVNIQGNLRVNVHYYEDGNVQLNTECNKNLTVAGGDPSTTAANIIKAIQKAEQDYHQTLEQSYATMGDTTFKALRRVLPITRAKIDWNKIRAMRMGSEASAR